MYEQSVDSVLHGTGNETFEAVKMLQAADPEKYLPRRGANYPSGRFGDSLRQVAQLIKAIWALKWRSPISADGTIT